MSMGHRVSDQKVFVVDDEAAVREAVAETLREAGLSVHAYASAEAFLDSYENCSGCLVLDVGLPDMDGLAVQQRLREQGSDLPIVFLSGQADVSMVVKAVKGGAVDFLEKPVDAATLVDRVHVCLEFGLQAGRAREQLEQVRVRWDRLTPREEEVAERLARGRNSKAIAADLGISRKTVDVHRGHIFEKLGVNSIAEITRMWLVINEQKPW